MKACKVDLFIHAVMYFAICSWSREQPTNFTYDIILDKAKSHDTAVTETPWPFQQQPPFPLVQSTPVTVTEYLLPGPLAGAAPPIPSQAAVLPLAHNLTIPTISSTCTTHDTLYIFVQKSRNWLFDGRISIHILMQRREGTNITARRDRKILIIIIHNHNSKIML